MKKRGRKGGTLGLIVASAVTIVLLGICFFFVSQLIGGGREHTNALDAACLNVAKHAVFEPNTTLQGTTELQNFATLGDDAQGRPGGSIINLRNYNRLFGFAALVAFNAEQDPGPGNRALNNANTLINALQDGDGSIGERLTRELSKTSGNVLFKHTDIAKDNSVRMLGKDSQVNHIEAEFRTSYLEQDMRDPQATNLALPPAQGGLAGEPADSVRKLFQNHGLITNVNGRDYVRGYEPLIAGSAVRVVGVPIPPGQQPHLVSRVDFDRQTTRFADISHSRVPPNGVRTVSTANASVPGSDNKAFSWAVVGTTNNQFPPTPEARNFYPSIPRGYIEVINGNLTNVGPIRSATWLENEGAPSRGTSVVSIPAGQIFGAPGIVSAWKVYNDKMADDPATAGPAPSVAGLFMRSGNASTPARFDQARQIRNLGVRCTDGNVGSGVCADLWNNSDGAFDHAYYGPATNIPGAGQGLTAIECADCQLEKMFNSVRSLTVNNSNCPESGLRIFKSSCDGNMTTSPKGSCNSTKPGTIRELGNFASRPAGRYTAGSVGAYGNTMINYIVSRMRQMKPTADQAEIDNFISTKLDTTNILPGKRYFIYVNEEKVPPSTGQLTQKEFVISETQPPGFTGDGPDGSVVPFAGGGNSITYTIHKGGDCGLINPEQDWGIHAVMYRGQAADTNFNGTDTAKLTRSSGFNNVLGRIEFSNSASGSSSLFSEPD